MMTFLLKLRRKLVYALAYDATFRALAPISGRRLLSHRTMGVDARGAAEAAGQLAMAGLSRG